ncbi:class III lanthipeptide [Actinacidiphila epipremni]|nr:class III lanthipeptide [Actinacidiphila epipremni]
MSILNMQRMAPIATDSAVAIWSTTSSGSDCCKTQPKKPAL